METGGADMDKLNDMRRGRVQNVSDEGMVVLLLPDGKQRIVAIPLETVPLVRRLAALDRELDRDRVRRASGQ
jgi:hypothetical protein